MTTFRLSHSELDAAFQPIAKVHVFYVYTIQWSVWASSPRSRAVAISPTGMKRKNIGSAAVSKWAFLV